MNRLRQIRERKSLSLAQVSARTSIPIRLLTDYEQGEVEIPQAQLKALAKALWVKPEELLMSGGSPEPQAAPVAATPVAPVPQRVEQPAPVAPVAAAPPPTFAPRPAPPPSQYGGSSAPMRPPQAPLPPRPAPSYAPESPRPAPRGGGGGGRARREPVPLPATEGQITEIMRLSARLNLSTEQLNTKFERSIADLSRFDAREWIKVLREEALTKAPPAKVHFGQWPGLKDDLEAVYLTELRNDYSILRVALFNGQTFDGQISDFTPYTITVKPTDGSDNVVLRKLAIAYYQRTGQGEGPGEETEADKSGTEVAPFAGPATPGFAIPSSDNSAGTEDV